MVGGGREGRRLSAILEAAPDLRFAPVSKKNVKEKEQLHFKALILLWRLARVAIEVSLLVRRSGVSF